MNTEVPAAPPGPGVRAPFAAPPTERDRKRLWIGLGVGAAAVVICCGGGIAGFIGLVVAQERALPREATGVVDTYLRDLRDQNYRQAYDQLCGAVQDQESLADFSARERNGPSIDDWTTDAPRIGTSEIFVPVHLNLSSGPDDREYVLVEDQRAGGLRICGGE